MLIPPCKNKYSKNFVQVLQMFQNLDILTFKILKCAYKGLNIEICLLPWKPSVNQNFFITYFVAGPLTTVGQNIRKIHFPPLANVCFIFTDFCS